MIKLILKKRDKEILQNESKKRKGGKDRRGGREGGRQEGRQTKAIGIFLVSGKACYVVEHSCLIECQ